MKPSLPGPTYRLVTSRLVIRCWNPVDAPLLKQSVDQSRDHLLPWMPWASTGPEDLEAYTQRLRRFRGNFDLDKDYVYGIFSQDERQVLGGTGLHTRVAADAREIGYWIHKDFVNQGLATETAAALTQVAFKVDIVQRVEIHCDPLNVRSAAVPRKLGFTHEATLRQNTIDGLGRRRDTMIWSLLASEYPSSPAARAEFKAFDAGGRQIV